MNTEILLLYTLRALAVLCVAALLVIGAQGLRLVLSRWALERRLASGRPALISLITAEAVSAEDLAPLRDIPPDDQDELLIALGRRLDGAAAVRLHELAYQVGAVDRARRLIRSRFWWRRLRGAQILTAVGGEEVEMLPLLSDRHHAVREQAIQWAADHPTPAVASRLLLLLGDPEDLSEFAILHSLIRLGDLVAEPLAHYLWTWSGRPLERALRVAAARPQPQYTAAALNLTTHPDGVVRARAAEVLASSRLDACTEILQRLLTDADARARCAAAEAIGERGFEPAAPQLARMLRDPEWNVRRAAGFALSELGDTGRDLLLRAATDEDPFASGMARQMLDVIQARSADG